LLASRATPDINNLTCAKSRRMSGRLEEELVFMASQNSHVSDYRNRFSIVFGVLWLLAVFGAYLFFNQDYFSEKIGTFGRFLLSGV